MRRFRVAEEVVFDSVEGIGFFGGIGRDGNQIVGFGFVGGAGCLFPELGHEVDTPGVIAFTVHLLRAVERVGRLLDADGFLCR